MLSDFPNKDEWIALEDSYPFEKIEYIGDIFQYTRKPKNQGEKLYIQSSIFIWKIHLDNRLYQTRWSYVMLMHLYNKGIPDDEWMRLPGIGEFATEYFPHFEEKDYFIKAQFDYFAGIFYFKLYSALDTIGHLLDVMYGLDINKVDFHKAINKLENVKPILFKNLKDIKDSQDFKQMQKFRHDTSHNELLGKVGLMGNKISENGYTFGHGNYITSTEIKDNVIKSLDLMVETLEAIKKQSKIDNSINKK